MTTDNRTNGQAPEQVEAAAVASINSHRSRAGLPTLATLDGVPNADEWRADARAALVAAAPIPQAVLALIERVRRVEAEREVAMRPHSECERSGAEAGEKIVDIECYLARAEAHIEELEGSLRLRHRHGVSQGQTILELEARIAEAAKLHRKYTYYEHEDSCSDTTDEHREEHHHEASDDIGEFYCDQMPTGDVCCDNCRDVNGDRVEWPCPTAVALGLNEGENDE